MDGRSPRLSLLLLLLLLLRFSLALQQLGIYHPSSTTTVGCHAPERDALMEFKRRLRDPSGRLSSWVGQDCCVWEGVGCSNTTGHVTQLDLRNRQRSGVWSDCSDEIYWVFHEYGCMWALFGGVSSSLLSLQHLRHLDLSGNFFRYDPIPDFLGSFTRLTYLNLSIAGFGGQVPDHLGNLSNLRHLDLSNNFYLADDGNVTASPSLYVEDVRWISRLASLRYLNMGLVSLRNASKWLPVMNALPHIQELRLANCEILSLFPPEDSLFHVSFTSLKVLDLSSNHINSTIPNWLFNVTSLERLYLGGNDLNWLDDDLASVSKLTSLRALDLSTNKFQNSFTPAALSKLCKLQSLFLSGISIKKELIDLGTVFSRSCLALSLEELDLSSTQLSGLLPDWLESMENIKHLDLSHNSLHGQLPASLGRWSSSLQYLDMGYNRLNGTIAEGMFRGMKGLVHLSLGGNSLILSEVNLANLAATLKHLDISYNTLVLNESYGDWIPPFQLQILYMSYCKMFPPKPKFPKWLATQGALLGLHQRGIGIRDTFPTWLPTTLTDIVLSNNEITGHFPSYLPNLKTLDLSNNSFSGQLPSTISNIMPTIRRLDLSMNNLSGRIPLSICQIKILFILQLSKNKFSGEVPDCWKNSTKIATLDLSSNSLQGEIPKSLCNLQRLRSLHLNNNNLSGQIPTTLKGCISLIVLDLGHNHLSGNIPTWIEENLRDLRVLSLHSNALEGNISSQLSKLGFLHVLDFSNNNLSGIIPLSFGDFNGLKEYSIRGDSAFVGYYGYSDRMGLFMKGREFEYADLLTYVRILDLSNNNLVGYIPEEVVKLRLLQSLNLSLNHLIGDIPRNINGVQHLEVLDLSRNNLSSVIPSSLASLTFLSILDLSYNNLSGKIPTGRQLQTFDQSNYIGNSNLCGFPLLKSCINDIKKYNDEGRKKGSDYEIILLFASIALGFIIGFWTICGVLIFNQRWRFAFFRIIDSIYVP